MRQKSRRRRRRNKTARWLPVLLTAVPVTAVAVILALTGGDKPLPGEAVAVPEYVEEAYISVNPYSRPGTPLKEISGVVIHYVGNASTTAKANRDYFDSLKTGAEGTYASSHFIVGLEGEVLQCVPLTEIAYATKERNADTVSVEVCHPGEDGEFSPVTYRQVVELTAWLCGTFELKAEDVIRHYDATGKVCPRYYVEHPEAWDTFRADVAEKMAELKAKP